MKFSDAIATGVFILIAALVVIFVVIPFFTLILLFGAGVMALGILVMFGLRTARSA